VRVALPSRDPPRPSLPGEGLSGSVWKASLDLVFEVRAGATVLARKRGFGPLSVQRVFRPEGRSPSGVVPAHACLLHPPGVLVTGDELETRVELKKGAELLLTTPGAEKVHRGRPGGGLQTRRFAASLGGDGETLEYLPSETIVFSGARAELSAEFDLGKNSRLIFWNVVTLGREKTGEVFSRGSFSETLSVRRDGVPAMLERFGVPGADETGRGREDEESRGGDVRGRALASPLALDGKRVFSLFAMVGRAGNAGDKEALTRAVAIARETAGASRETFPERVGATLRETPVAPVFVARSLGDSVMRAKSHNEALWKVLRPVFLGREPCPPGVWRT
jgi:urease accessory protein